MYQGKDNVPPGKMSFMGRTEQLDWKKIASIDIDNLIQEGDTTQLVELIKPVTFCKADVEFDGGGIKIDPGFIKVFRISQLISEFLLASQEKTEERLADLRQKYNETEKEKEKLSEEILHLKETIASAKKELKKRKEMLANKQNVMLGENNSDEYDQCPYCPKKFIRPGYLLDHIQRRHQGLPVNPLYPSLPPGPAAVVCHHSHPQTPQTSHHQWHPYQQTPVSGSIYDPNISLPPQSSQHVQTMMNHQMFPAVHTPSPSIPLHNNHQVLPSNLSFSGSVTSLNNLPFNQHFGNGGGGAASSSGTLGGNLGKRESFTQTSIQTNENYVDLKASSHLELLPEEIQIDIHTQHQDESFHASDKHSPDSLNQLPNTNSPLIRAPLSITSSAPMLFTVDGSQPNATSSTTAADDDGGGDAAAAATSGMVNTSTLRNRERVEATKEGNVFRLPNQQLRYGPTDEKKARQNGTDGVANNATISANTTKGPATTCTRFSTNSSQSYLREDGEVTEPPADVINHPQFGGVSEKEAKDFAELKRLLQASVQGELHPLISRLESHEQSLQDKLASLQQDHERQIQQLRHELKVQNETRRNNNGQILDENGVELADDKLGARYGEREKDNEHNISASSGNVPPPPGIILVGPKGGQHPFAHHQQEFGARLGSQRGLSHDDGNGESNLAPVAKPRKSCRVDAGEKVTYSYSDTEHMSSAEPSPISTRVHDYSPIIQPHHHQQQYYQGTSETRQQNKHYPQRERGTMAELQSLSESDPEFLTIIQPEEFHEGKHDNSIVPKSSDASATSTTAGTVAANNKGSQQNQRHLMSLRPSQARSASGVVVAGMNKSGGRGAEDEMAATTLATTQVKSDEASDYTPSDSEDSEDDDDERNNDICTVSPKKNDRHRQQHQQKRNHHVEFSNQPRRKSSPKPAPAKKKYIFDAEARKIVEVSPDDEEDEDDEDENSDLNNTPSADDDLEGGRKKRKSQLDLVRAKTLLELDQEIDDIGLNPESTAIGVEEMKRAQRHFEARKTTVRPDQIHDYERLEEEREAVKSRTRMEAEKSTIDEKLDRISTLSEKRSQKNSLVKIFSAVKSSGKNFGKRVASAVKKKHKSEHGTEDEDEEKTGFEKRNKKKPLYAPAMKTAFFSKARWTRKKKGEGIKKGGSAAAVAFGEKQPGEGKVENTSDYSSSSESEAEVELPPFMQRSNTSGNRNRRAGSSSRSSERHASSGPSRHNSTRSTRSGSRQKTVKPLKRLNSTARSTTPSHQPKSLAAATAVERRHSSESSPFSNVDDQEEEDIGGRSSSMSYENSVIGDNETVEQAGNHPNNKTQGKQRIQEQKGHKESTNPRHCRNPQESTSEDDDDNDYADGKLTRKKTTLKRAGRKESQEDEDEVDAEKGVEDVCSSSSSPSARRKSGNSGESQSEDDEVDWDEDGEQVSFATSNEILTNAKSSGVVSVSGRHHHHNNDKGSNNEERLAHDEDNKEQIEVMGRHYPTGKSNSVTRKSENWNTEMSDTRLNQIKQYVSKSKKEVIRDRTSYSEEGDSAEEFVGGGGGDRSAWQEQRTGSSQHTHYYVESKHNYPRERKMAFVEPNGAHFLPKSASNALQKWATATDVEESKHGQRESPVLPHFIASSPQTSKQTSRHGTAPELSITRKQSQWHGKSENDNVSAFLTSTPLASRRAGSGTTERGQGETVRNQQPLDNSFDEMNDLDDLLNTNTTISDDEERLPTKIPAAEVNTNNARQSESGSHGSTLSGFKRKPVTSVMQPTNHHHLSGLASLRSRAEAQNKLLEESVRDSRPGSRNSWDSQK